MNGVDEATWSHAPTRDPLLLMSARVKAITNASPPGYKEGCLDEVRV